MKNLKKFLAILICLGTVAATTACGSVTIHDITSGIWGALNKNPTVSAGIDNVLDRLGKNPTLTSTSEAEQEESVPEEGTSEENTDNSVSEEGAGDSTSESSNENATAPEGESGEGSTENNNEVTE